jgi:UDP-glucose 4-epimerase
MKASFIGCNGYIGRHLSAFLIEKGWLINGYDVEDHSKTQLSSYIPLNLEDKKQIGKIDTSVDFIFYFSGITGTIKGFENFEQYIDINEKGLLYVLDLMRSSKSQARIIFPSSRLVYKGVKNKKLKEDAKKEFKTIYSLNKWFGEQVIQQYNIYFGLNYNIFRICVPYGNVFDDGYSYGTIGFFLNKAKVKEDIILFGDGKQKRTFTHVQDICLQIFQTIEHESSINTIFNIDGETFSLNEIAGKIAKKFNINVRYKDWDYLDKKLETGDTIFDGEKINMFSNKLKITFNQWLDQISI